MSVLDALRETMAGRIIAPNPPDEQSELTAVFNEGVAESVRVLDAFEAAHPGLEDHTETCVVCGGPMKVRGNTLVVTAEYGHTLGWQHSGCVGKPAVTE